MLKTVFTLVTLMLLSATTATFAAEAHDNIQTKEDITRHRAISKAHADVAICLESGKNAEVCSKALQTACKGLAIGKDCGMKHVH